MRENKKNNIEEYPHTSLPSIGTFSKIFKDNLKEYQMIIVVTISSDISGTYNAALQALNSLNADLQKRVLLIDSRHGSVSEALILLDIIEFCKKKNVSIDDIKARFDVLIPKARLIATIDDPSWLEAGGRIGKVKAIIIRQMIKMGIRPILSVTKGNIELLKIKVNVKEKNDALFLQFKDEIEAVKNSEGIRVVISHGDNKEEADKLKNKITEYNKKIKVEFETCCSAVFGAHLGPDSLLLGWIVE